MAFKNYRVYILTSVAYLGSLLFGELAPTTLTLTIFLTMSRL
jgi:hypothetical protein